MPSKLPQQTNNIALMLLVQNVCKEIWVGYWLISVVCLVFATTSEILRQELISCYIATCMYIFMKSISYVYLIEKQNVINDAIQLLNQNQEQQTPPLVILPVVKWLFCVSKHVVAFVVLPSIIFLTS